MSNARAVNDVLFEFREPKASSGEFFIYVRQIEYQLEYIVVGSNNEG